MRQETVSADSQDLGIHCPWFSVEYSEETPGIVARVAEAVDLGTAVLEAALELDFGQESVAQDTGLVGSVQMIGTAIMNAHTALFALV